MFSASFVLRFCAFSVCVLCVSSVCYVCSLRISCLFCMFRVCYLCVRRRARVEGRRPQSERKTRVESFQTIIAWLCATTITTTNNACQQKMQK